MPIVWNVFCFKDCNQDALFSIFIGKVSDYAKIVAKKATVCIVMWVMNGFLHIAMISCYSQCNVGDGKSLWCGKHSKTPLDNGFHRGKLDKSGINCQVELLELKYSLWDGNSWTRQYFWNCKECPVHYFCAILWFNGWKRTTHNM